MAIRTNARLLAEDVAVRVSDPTHLTWSVDSILQQADGILDRLWTKTRSGGSDHRLTEEVIQISAFAVLDGQGGHLRGYMLPEHVGAIRAVELRTSTGGRQPIPSTPLEGRYENINRGPVYYRGPADSLVIAGHVDGYETVVVAHILKWPPLHYGVVQAGVTGSSMTLQQPNGTTAFGRAVRRSGLYAGSAIEFGSGAQADAIVMISSNTGGVVTWAPTLAPAPAVSDQYAIVVPLEGQHTEYFKELVVEALLRRDGDVQRLAAMRESTALLERDFKNDVTQRDQNTPRRVMAVRRRV